MNKGISKIALATKLLVIQLYASTFFQEMPTFNSQVTDKPQQYIPGTKEKEFRKLEQLSIILIQVS